MRSIPFVLAFVLAFIGLAFAQDTESQRITAARELIVSVTLDDRILDLVEAAARDQAPSQQAIRSSPAFQRYTPQHQAALLASIETLPQHFRNEFRDAMEPVATRVAQRVFSLMSAEEFLAAAQAFRDPENDALFREAVARAMSQQDSDSAFPDLSTTEPGRRFLASPAGQAFTQARPSIDRIIAEESVGLSALGPRLRLVGMAAACDALEDECPETTRAQLGRP